MTQLDRSWSPPPQVRTRSGRNISEAERWISGLGGAALAAWVLQQRRRDPWVLGAGALSAMLLAGTVAPDQIGAVVNMYGRRHLHG